MPFSLPVVRAAFVVPPVVRAAVCSLCAAAVLCGCNAFRSTDKVLGIVTPYKVEIVQGNVITKEQITVLKIGMSRAQVRDVLGSPLLTDAFHTDRWDYVFTIRRQGAPAQDRRVMLTFAGDTLKTVSGADDLPGEREFVSSIDTFRTRREAPSLELTPEQIRALPAPKVVASAEAASGAASAPQRSYPPLEAR